MRRACLVGLLLGLLLVRAAHAQEAEVYTRADVAGWVDDYAWWYETAAWPHDVLVQRALSVARCETGNWDERVINNARRGRYGEVGTFQFLPGPRSIFWLSPQGQAGYDYWDREANVAAAVYLIANGYGRHWTCF